MLYGVFLLLPAALAAQTSGSGSIDSATGRDAILYRNSPMSATASVRSCWRLTASHRERVTRSREGISSPAANSVLTFGEFSTRVSGLPEVRRRFHVTFK